jgi:hypothetical protein
MGKTKAMRINATIILGVLAFSTSVYADTGSLPLRPGVYVDTAASCHGATSSTRSWFGGGYVIQAPHARCVAKAVSQSGPTRYRLTLRCYEQGDPTLAFDLAERVRIVSRREYELENRFGRFRARWCRP